MDDALASVRYLKQTAGARLVFKKLDSEQITVYADADFSADDESMSTSGTVVLYAGNMIGWSSVRQRTVALSTCEAENNSIVEGATEAVYCRELLAELLQKEIEGPTII